MKVVGVNNIIKKDLDNIKQLAVKNDETISNFIRHLQNKGYQVNYHTNEEDRVTAIFFIHDNALEELRRFPEAVVLDTTYNTSKQKMKLLSFVVPSTLASREGKQKGNQLATIPVAAAWLD